MKKEIKRNNGRFIIVVLDSFGIGEMDDVKIERVQDIGANTYKSVVSKVKGLKLSTLQKFGIVNAAGLEIESFKFQLGANFGICNLKHYGCDTFYGHHELMGTNPKRVVEEPFKNNIDLVEKTLRENGYNVERYGSGVQILLVNNAISVGDNLEADLGQVYNVTGSFQKVTYEELLEVGKIVRGVVKVPRVIAFGGENATIESIKMAYRTFDGKFAGVNAPLSKVYEKGYKVLHMGYGIDSKVQLPTIIGKEVPVTLIGKVADIVENPYGKSYPEVDTENVMKILINSIKESKKSFICANIQETDLAGHREDSVLYGEKLEIVDRYLIEIIQNLSQEDILIITADHGNDPEIGHSGHTREKVPILIYSKNLEGAGIEIGERDTLADIGQSAAEYFGYTLPDNGISFLEKLLK